MIRLSACLTVVLAPSILSAQQTSFDGLWRTNPTTECVYSEDGSGALKIEDDTLFGAENTCAMTNPVNVRDMDAVLFDMECEGEGQTFAERAMFLAAADGGLFLIWDGFAFKYEACTGDGVNGAVITSDQIGITD